MANILSFINFLNSDVKIEEIKTKNIKSIKSNNEVFTRSIFDENLFNDLLEKYKNGIDVIFLLQNVSNNDIQMKTYNFFLNSFENEFGIKINKKFKNFNQVNKDEIKNNVLLFFDTDGFRSYFTEMGILKGVEEKIVLNQNLTGNLDLKEILYVFRMPNDSFYETGKTAFSDQIKHLCMYYTTLNYKKNIYEDDQKDKLYVFLTYILFNILIMFEELKNPKKIENKVIEGIQDEFIDDGLNFQIFRDPLNNQITDLKDNEIVVGMFQGFKNNNAKDVMQSFSHFIIDTLNHADEYGQVNYSEFVEFVKGFMQLKLNNKVFDEKENFKKIMNTGIEKEIKKGISVYYKHENGYKGFSKNVGLIGDYMGLNIKVSNGIDSVSYYSYNNRKCLYYLFKENAIYLYISKQDKIVNEAEHDLNIPLQKKIYKDDKNDVYYINIITEPDQKTNLLCISLIYNILIYNEIAGYNKSSLYNISENEDIKVYCKLLYLMAFTIKKIFFDVFEEKSLFGERFRFLLNKLAEHFNEKMKDLNIDFNTFSSAIGTKADTQIMNDLKNQISPITNQFGVDAEIKLYSDDGKSFITTQKFNENYNYLCINPLGYKNEVFLKIRIK